MEYSKQVKIKIQSGLNQILNENEKKIIIRQVEVNNENVKKVNKYGLRVKRFSLFHYFYSLFSLFVHFHCSLQPDVL